MVWGVKPVVGVLPLTPQAVQDPIQTSVLVLPVSSLGFVRLGLVYFFLKATSPHTHIHIHTLLLALLPSFGIF